MARQLGGASACAASSSPCSSARSHVIDPMPFDRMMDTWARHVAPLQCSIFGMAGVATAVIATPLNVLPCAAALSSCKPVFVWKHVRKGTANTQRSDAPRKFTIRGNTFIVVRPMGTAMTPDGFAPHPSTGDVCNARKLGPS